ncbi:hypothetical protein FHT71_001990 [Rhizobium sp. BK060]|nr:hypothetical protein [Rhizobium sp. BK060]
MRLEWLDATLAHGIDIFGRGAEDRKALLRSIVPQHIAGGREGRTVEQAERRAAREPGGQPVPHHPAAGGEVKKLVALPYPGMETVFLEVLKQGTACGMDNAFRHPGRA